MGPGNVGPLTKLFPVFVFSDDVDCIVVIVKAAGSLEHSLI